MLTADQPTKYEKMMNREVKLRCTTSRGVAGLKGDDVAAQINSGPRQRRSWPVRPAGESFRESPGSDNLALENIDTYPIQQRCTVLDSYDSCIIIPYFFITRNK